MTRYRTIVADPPWPGKWTEGGPRLNGSGRRYAKKPLAYSVMDLASIEALPVSELAEHDAHLYLWIPDGLLIEGVAARVMRCWGFEPGRSIVWWKPTPGLGRFPRPCHEVVVLGRRGQLPYATSLTDVSSVQRWKEQRVGAQRVHSGKPDGFLDLVEQASPGPYVELFARRARFGWDYWGDESLGTAELPSAQARSEASTEHDQSPVGVPRGEVA